MLGGVASFSREVTLKNLKRAGPPGVSAPNGPSQTKETYPPVSARRDINDLDRWLQNLHKEHPILFSLLALGLGLAFLGAVLLVKWLVER